MWACRALSSCHVFFFFFFFISQTTRDFFSHRLGEQCRTGPCAPRGEGAALMGTAVRRRGWQLEWERIAVRRNGPGRACSIGTCLARRRQLVDGNETKHGVVGGKRRRKEGCCGLWDGLHM
ncbi:hypothetical protein IWZ00DRAFT_517670 [Phyllosticta capitalensis]